MTTYPNLNLEMGLNGGRGKGKRNAKIGRRRAREGINTGMRGNGRRKKVGRDEEIGEEERKVEGRRGEKDGEGVQVQYEICKAPPYTMERRH